MVRYPIYFDGALAMDEIARALASIHVHLRSDGAGRMVAEPVPAYLRKSEEQPENVVQLRRKRSK